MMKNLVDCEEFQDILDSSLPGTLSEADLGLLESHAASCADCSIILDSYLHFSRIPEEELLDSVPEEIDSGMWERVDRGISARAGGTFRQAYSSRWRGPVVAGLSAAIVLLVLVSVFLLAEVKRMRNIESLLHSRLAFQEERLSVLSGELQDKSGSPGVPSRSDAAFRLAAVFSGGMTLSDILDGLSGMDPAETVIEYADIASQGPPGWTMRKDRGPIILSGIDLSDGIQAGEALRILRNSGIDPGTRMTRETIGELSRKYGPQRPGSRYM